MAKVIQVRDVPDEIHDALVAAASAEGLSLNGYIRRELASIAHREQAMADNVRVAERSQSNVRRRVRRDEVLAALHEGRDR